MQFRAPVHYGIFGRMTTPRREIVKPGAVARHHGSSSADRGAVSLTFSMKTVERSLFAVGAALCLFYLGVTAYRSAASRLAVQTFGASSSTPEPAPARPAAA